jgi:hypothetical protein
LIVLSACGSDEPQGPVREQVTALRGVVTNTLPGPLGGVRISAGGVSTSSAADGRYELRVPAGAHVVRFEKTGFVTTFERVDVVSMSPTQLDASLLELAPGMPLDATAGGAIVSARGAGLMAPPMGFVDRDGEAVTGMVTVHLTPIDPSMASEMRAAPGDFTAEMGGTEAMIESFGMMDITVMQGTETLQVATGQELEIRIPVAGGATAPEAMQALWSFDEARGIWVDEGMAMFDAASGTYVARTTHMSIWNVDKPYLATCLCGTVTERGAGPLPGSRVTSSGLDYFGTSEATTDSEGRFCIAVRKDSRVSVAAYHASGGGSAVEVTSGANDTEVPPMRGDARCVDIGNIEVERDTFRYPDGSVTRCGETGNPFASACGAEFWAVYECYMPVGECTIRSTAAGSTITYANGSRYVSMFDGATMMISGELRSPTDVLCATMTSTLSSDPMADLMFTYSTPAGRQFVITVPGGDTGDMLIGCPDGSTVTVTPEERQAVEACQGSPDGMSSQCTVEGGGGNCTDTSDCASMPGTMCCPVSGAGNVCIAVDECPADPCGGACSAMQFCDPGTMTCRSYCDFVMCTAPQVCNPATLMCE